MYPEGFSTFVEEAASPRSFAARRVPGIFAGSAPWCSSFSTSSSPGSAVFGLKDFQQCAVIRRMVRDLDLPVRIVAAPTVREPDGLALSSRNRYLTPEERAQAPVLRAGLLSRDSAWLAGERAPTASG